MKSDELKNERWKEFLIAGDEGLFNISSTNSGIDKNKLNNENGNIPYITRSNENNGINLFVSNKQDTKWNVDEKNTITIGLDTQTVFYQPYKFYTGQNIQILKHQKINKETAMFIISMLKVQMKKFNWGGNGATLGRLCRTKLMLPIDSTGEPNWSFMEDYIKNMEQKKIIDYIAFVTEKNKKIEYKRVPELKDKKWKEFCIGDIYDIKSGCSLTKENMINGNTPFIGASANNNAVTNFVSNTNRSLDKNVVNINFNGSVGEAFYHPYTALFSGDVKRLHLKDYPDNEYINLFIITLIKAQKDKYSYGYKFSEKRMIRQYIKLPVNDAGDPDYEYMEQYIKNMEYDKIIEYMAYIA